MAYLTFNDLATKTFKNARNLNESIASRNYRERMVFLSYRREDREWVDDVVRFLKRIGANIYIDYLDETLEEKTNEQVAQALRDRIHASSKFVSLATPNRESRNGCPGNLVWETGLSTMPTLLYCL